MGWPLAILWRKNRGNDRMNPISWSCITWQAKGCWCFFPSKVFYENKFRIVFISKLHSVGIFGTWFPDMENYPFFTDGWFWVVMAEVVSHDANFLDQICTDIIHFDEAGCSALVETDLWWRGREQMAHVFCFLNVKPGFLFDFLWAHEYNMCHQFYHWDILDQFGRFNDNGNKFSLWSCMAQGLVSPTLG